MTGMIVNFLVDIIIMGLLVVTIGYCWVLNRRIQILQDSKSELAQLLSHFDESTMRASESIIALQTASKKIGENIQHRIDKANYMMDDLAFMVEKANKIANQLEAGFAVNRARNRVLEEQQDAPEPAEPQEEAHSKPVAPERAQPKTSSEKSAAARERTAATLEAVLDRVVGRGKPAKPANDREEGHTHGRSRSEQELLEMIRTGIKG